MSQDRRPSWDPEGTSFRTDGTCPVPPFPSIASQSMTIPSRSESVSTELCVSEPELDEDELGTDVVDEDWGVHVMAM